LGTAPVKIDDFASDKNKIKSSPNMKPVTHLFQFNKNRPKYGVVNKKKIYTLNSNERNNEEFHISSLAYYIPYAGDTGMTKKQVII
jgi:hypothetical protein